MEKLRKIFIGTLLWDELSHSRVKVINISVEDIDGWQTCIKLLREDGTDVEYEATTLIALIKADLLLQHADNLDA